MTRDAPGAGRPLVIARRESYKRHARAYRLAGQSLEAAAPLRPRLVCLMQPIAVDREVIMQKCPVCGMEVDEKTALRTTHQGQTFYFCSQQCKDAFVKKPEAFVAPAVVK